MKIVNPTAKFGEDLATKFLQRKGFKILERNFGIRYGEIDIIALDYKENSLVFIEVKTRTSNNFGTPLESITSRKIDSLVKTAQFYKLTHPLLPENLRIDAISVNLFKDKDPKIEHIKNIVQ